MNEVLRARLDQIDEWLLDPRIGGYLADILSAVRGPDNDSTSSKDNMTNPIRRAAFPKTFEAASGFGHPGAASCWYVKDTASKYNEAEEIASGHFLHHANMAAHALGLK